MIIKNTRFQCSSNLIACALKIAEFQQYPVLSNGLQTLTENWSGVGLIKKLHHEWDEFYGARLLKTPDHQIHEGSDILYYSAQIDKQLFHIVPGMLCDFFDDNLSLLVHAYDLDEELLLLSAQDKYEYRSAAKNNKNEALELQMIRKRRAEIGR